MSDGAGLLKDAFDGSAEPGPEVVPDALIDSVSLDSDPSRAMGSLDRGNAMFEALLSQFEFVNFARVSGKELKSEEAATFAGLLRWLTRGLCNWNETDDPDLRKLTALFVVSSFCDVDDAFWALVPLAIGANQNLALALRRHVARFGVEFAARGLGAAPLWELEAVETFKQADRDRDWVAIANSLRLFEPAMFPNPFLVQSARCLARFDPAGLLEAVAGVEQAATAVAVVRPLTRLQALQLGATTENQFVQFAAARTVLSSTRDSEGWTTSEEELLTELLLRVAGDTPRWSCWMQVFNFWPQHFPALQAPLGRALALAPGPAMEAYVAAPNLSTTDSGNRLVVANCLRSFRASAEPKRRKVLWRAAFVRWEKWRFGADDEHTPITDISNSELDFAVVGYAVECLDADERDEVLRGILAKLQAVDDDWYRSVTDCKAEWNRLLSRYQPFLHAGRVAQTGEDWLWEGKQYFPFNPATEPYIAMKFDMPQRRIQAFGG